MCRWRFSWRLISDPSNELFQPLYVQRPGSLSLPNPRRRGEEEEEEGARKGYCTNASMQPAPLGGPERKGNSNFREAGHSSNLRTTCSGALWATRRDRLLKEALWFRLLPGVLPVRTKWSHDSLDRISFRLRRFSILSFHSLPSWRIVNMHIQAGGYDCLLKLFGTHKQTSTHKL